MDIGAGGYHSFALQNDGTVQSWGYNAFGELGNGTEIDSSIPVAVNFLTDVTSISGGVFHSLAVKSDGTAWVWGFNGYGQLGDGTYTTSNVPMLLSSIGSTTTLLGGDIHTVALKNDGTVWCFGYNTSGQLGNGGVSTSNIPIQTTGLCNIALMQEEFDPQLTTSVYPNPGSDILYIQSFLEIESVQCMNYLGQQINLSVENNVVNISTLAAGTYFLKIISESGSKVTKKFIKQ